jgi:hypothetical protein
MIAMRLTNQELERRYTPRRSIAATGRDGERSHASQADATVSGHFQPLDPAIINKAIPAFFIGRNSDGFWVARDVGGRIGGIFLLENSAVSFARKNSSPTGCATVFPSGRIELDLENNGNRLVSHLGPLVRWWQRTLVFIGKMAEFIAR